MATPSDLYLESIKQNKTDGARLSNYIILVTTPAFDNQGNLLGMENFIVAVVTKLAASTLVYNISSVSAPAITNAASGALLTSEITVSILTSWS